MARGFPAVWLIAGCACAWQRDVAGRMAGRACTNRPRLCPGDEVDACGLRLETWCGLSPLFPCEGNHISCSRRGRAAGIGCSNALHVQWQMQVHNHMPHGLPYTVSALCDSNGRGHLFRVPAAFREQLPTARPDRDRDLVRPRQQSAGVGGRRRHTHIQLPEEQIFATVYGPRSYFDGEPPALSYRAV